MTLVKITCSSRALNNLTAWVAGSTAPASATGLGKVIRGTSTAVLPILSSNYAFGSAHSMQTRETLISRYSGMCATILNLASTFIKSGGGQSCGAWSLPTTNEKQYNKYKVSHK
jgi:hypothetical protein